MFSRQSDCNIMKKIPKVLSFVFVFMHFIDFYAFFTNSFIDGKIEKLSGSK